MTPPEPGGPSRKTGSWLLEQDRVQTIPIVGARIPEQLRKNAGAVDIALSDEQWARIVEACDE